MTGEYDGVDPEEIVTVTGFGPMSLHKAVLRYIQISRTPGAQTMMIVRKAGMEPATFNVNDLGRMAEMERFRWSDRSIWRLLGWR